MTGTEIYSEAESMLEISISNTLWYLNVLRTPGIPPLPSPPVKVSVSLFLHTYTHPQEILEVM